MRIPALLICACWIASYSSSGFAQTLPPCDRNTAEQITYAGGVPPLVGCSVTEVEDLFSRLRQSHRVDLRPDQSASGVAPRIITRQEQKELNLTFYFSTGAGYPPAQPPSFSISAPPKVTEGDQLPITIHREGNDGHPHSISLYYKPGELLVDPPTTIDSDAVDKIVPLTTAPGQPGDGDKTVDIWISTDEGARPGNPRLAAVTILDRKQTTYSVESPQGVDRGNTLQFIVRRDGPATEPPAEYQLVQPGGGTDEAWKPLMFSQDGSATLRFAGNDYAMCGDPPSLRVRDSANKITEAPASFSDYVPKPCGPPPPPTILEWLERNVPYWPLPTIPIAALVVFGLWKLVRRIFNDDNSDKGQKDDRGPPVPPVLRPTWELEAGPPSPAPAVREMPRWPTFSCDVKLEWEKLVAPEPLPIVEADNG